MFGAVGNIFRVPELRRRLALTFTLLLIYRIGFQVPLPGVDLAAIETAASKMGSGALGGLFGIMNAFTGAGIGDSVIFSLGVMPYISASIIFSLLVKVLPSLEALSKEGAAGQKKINQYTRLATVPICILQGFFVYKGVVVNQAYGLRPEGGGFFYAMLVILALTAGTLFIMWIGEQITEHGVGNGVSLIIMGGIIARMPSSLASFWASADDVYGTTLTLVSMWLVTVLVVVYITRGQRRIPIQQAKLTRGRRVYGGSKHYLPLKVNQAGVMPIIFASALFIVPNVLGSIPGMAWFGRLFSSTGFVYLSSYALLIFFFSFFWTKLMFQPEEIANNLKEHGSFIPGIRPGANTSAYLERVISRVTLAGAAFLAVVALLPTIVTANMNVQPMLAYFLGGTSILIVVGVALDLVDSLNSYLVMRNYDGFTSTGGSGWARKRG